MAIQSPFYSRSKRNAAQNRNNMAVGIGGAIAGFAIAVGVGSLIGASMEEEAKERDEALRAEMRKEFKAALTAATVAAATATAEAVTAAPAAPAAVATPAVPTAPVTPRQKAVA